VRRVIYYAALTVLWVVIGFALLVVALSGGRP
jgi:hypothetical protein